MNLEDTNLLELLKQVRLWALIVIIFGGLFTYILIKRFGGQGIFINEIIDSRRSVVVFVTTTKTSNNTEIEKVLKNYEVDYEIVYKDKERYFEDFLKKINSYEEDVKEPALVCIESGTVTNIIKEINNSNDLIAFIEYNRLSGKGR